MNRFLSNAKRFGLSSLLAMTLVAVQPSYGQVLNNADNSSGGWGMKIFDVDSSAYPFVSVFVRTFDGNKNPLRNVNNQNVGIIVKGKTYSPFKQQYLVQTVKQTQLPVRTVMLIDASITMAGAPFESTLRAAATYIAEKEPNDQVAIIEMDDSKIGYSVVSDFSSDGSLPGSRLGGLQPTATETRIFDSVGASLQMCRSAGSEKTSSTQASRFASCSLILFSDGHDTVSALTRPELTSAMSNMGIPIPIHSLGYTKDFPIHLKNLQALSEISFGKYFDASESLGSMNSVLQNLQAIGKNDLIITFRSYLDVDGEDHSLKVGMEYPARSGSVNYGNARFEAMDSIPIPQVDQVKAEFEKVLKPLADGNPYHVREGSEEILNQDVEPSSDKEVEEESASSTEDEAWWKFW